MNLEALLVQWLTYAQCGSTADTITAPKPEGLKDVNDVTAAREKPPTNLTIPHHIELVDLAPLDIDDFSAF